MQTEVQKLARKYADLDRRLRTIEGGQRSGLGDAALDSGSGGFTITSFGTDNWQDDASGGTTPEVTLETGSRVMIFATFRPQNMGTAGASVGVTDFRSSNGVMGIQIDSTEPQDWSLPPMRSQFSLITTNLAFLWLPFALSTFREDLEPGEHTFTMRFWAQDTVPANTVNPVITDTFLMVLPLGYA